MYRGFFPVIYKEERRSVFYMGTEIGYLLIRKQVKNLNLRVRRDSSIVVSANNRVHASRVDSFVKEKGAYILSVLQRLKKTKDNELPPKQYISGETCRILGKEVQLIVEQGEKDSVICEEEFLYMTLKNPEDFNKRKGLIQGYLDAQCRSVFTEIMLQAYSLMQKYGVSIPMPTLRMRKMKTRWGSCTPTRGIITLNKRLLEYSRDCIEFVALHEFCHFIHPNHSKQFYNALSSLMPDWKERKARIR